MASATTALNAGLCQMSTGRRNRTELRTGNGRTPPNRAPPPRFPAALTCLPIEKD
ncbi:hypothetical protein GCM10017688_00520 [Streptomyces ramulosus]